MNNKGFTAIGAGVLMLAALLAAGASSIPGEAGYAGAGPAALPWAVAASMALLGILLIVTARRATSPLVPSPEASPHWRAMAWVSAGLVLNALLLERLGFIPSCALLFALAARGFRLGANGRPSLLTSARDVGIGALISAPVFWSFTRLLGVNLPSLITAGWI